MIQVGRGGKVTDMQWWEKEEGARERKEKDGTGHRLSPSHAHGTEGKNSEKALHVLWGSPIHIRVVE